MGHCEDCGACGMNERLMVCQDGKLRCKNCMRKGKYKELI